MKIPSLVCQIARFTLWLGLSSLYAFFPASVLAATVVVNTTTVSIVDDNQCSLVEAIMASNTNRAAHGCPAGDEGITDTIVLAANATYRLTTVYEYSRSGPYDPLVPETGLPAIDGAVIISGNGATLVREALAPFRLLHVSGLGSLSLHDVTLRNGYAYEGGAIKSDGAITIENSHILGNRADSGGGGIYIVTTRAARIANTEIANNQAGQGGGIANVSAPLEVTTSTIEGNEAAGSGGGIYNDVAVLTVTAVTLNANSANVGGALFNRGSLIVSDTEMVGNWARQSGGALYHEDWVSESFRRDYGLSVFHTRLLDNRALGNGGALYTTGGMGRINESCLAGNSPVAIIRMDGPRLDATANWWGSAAGPSGVGPGEGDSVGAYILFGDYKNAPILNCPSRPPASESYLAYTTLDPGGQLITVSTTLDADVAVNDGNCTLVEAMLAANTNTPHDQCPAGSTANDIVVLAKDATYSLGQGYADYEGLTALPIITGTLTIRGNGATIERSGHAAFRLLRVTFQGKLTLQDVTLRYGSAVNGGAIYNRGTLLLDHSRILSNTASRNGGGIYNASTINLETRQWLGRARVITYHDTQIAFNQAMNGGGIYSEDYGDLALTDTEISFNHAGEGGGLISEDGTATLARVRLLSNQAQANGGALTNQSSTVTLIDSEVSANRAGQVGGGIYQPVPSGLYTTSLGIYHSRFLNNQAAAGGSALQLYAGWQVRVYQSCIVGNQGVAVGGAAYELLATFNWWGAADGPSGAGPGSGDSVVAGTIVLPYLTTAISGCPSSGMTE